MPGGGFIDESNGATQPGGTGPTRDHAIVPALPALYEAMDQVTQVQAGKLAIPRRYGADMNEIWVMQPRFLQRSVRR